MFGARLSPFLVLPVFRVAEIVNVSGETLFTVSHDVLLLVTLHAAPVVTRTEVTLPFDGGFHAFIDSERSKLRPS